MTQRGEPRPSWIAGETPSIRQQGRRGAALSCPFCGADSAILSFEDRSADYGRVELYCDSPDCDARQIVILLRRGEGANQRADVRALNAVDKYAPLAEKTPNPLEVSDDEYEPESLDADEEQRLQESAYSRWLAVNESDPETRRRFSQEPFRIDVKGSSVPQ